MLDDAEVISTVRDLWQRHKLELPDHDRVYNYVRGKHGVPEVPDGAGDELQDIARMSVKNVLRLVREAFVQPLSIIGFRSPESTENSEGVWQLWQQQKLDARQALAYRPAVEYGTSYAIIAHDGIRFRSPRQVFAVYADATVDEWPVFALESWIDRSSKKPVRRGWLYDETHRYPVNLGTLSEHTAKAEQASSLNRRMSVSIDEDREAEQHGFEHPPVVRFVNDQETEDLVEGEISPLIGDQKAINAVNFDRLVVSRYGAFPQKYVIGWAPASSAELVKASVQRLMAFEDETVKAGDFAPASTDGYNAILAEMMVHVALTAKVPPFGLTGSFANLAVDALALIAKPYQDKLRNKQASFGESMEQALRAYAFLQGVDVPEGAEVIWDETDARSFAQVVDGISKLQAAGVPIEALIEDVPGWTQQRVTVARAAIRKAAGAGLVASLRGSQDGAPAIVTPAVTEAGDIKAKADALGVLIRAGVDSEAAAKMVGLDGAKFTGAVPVSLRLPESDASGLEKA